LILFILTEGLVVQIFILLLSFFVLRSLKTAVNSICLGTCSSCFFHLTQHENMSQKCKSTTFLASVLKVFENFAFLPYSPCNQRQHLLNLSKNFVPFVGKDNSFISHKFILPLKGILICFH
jgi:hypothetical protein